MKIGLNLENCYGINKLVEELGLTRIDGIDGNPPTKAMQSEVEFSH